MFVLDSSAIIELLKNGPRTPKLLDVLQDEPIEVTSITLHELLIGAYAERQRALIDELLMDAQILEHNEYAAHAGARIERELSRRGESIGPRDILIAAACTAHSGTLVTCDTDFARIKGLKVHVID